REWKLRGTRETAQLVHYRRAAPRGGLTRSGGPRSRTRGHGRDPAKRLTAKDSGLGVQVVDLNPLGLPFGPPAISFVPATRPGSLMKKLALFLSAGLAALASAQQPSTQDIA